MSHRSKPPRLTALTAALVAFLGAAGSAGNARGDEGPWHLCGQAVAQIDAANAIPDYMLTAIALVESGRLEAESGEKLAWPWTVTAQGQGRYLPSKAAAVAEVKALQAKGVSNIDVGCMQINLRYNPDAFADLEAALDPVQNVAYAAKLLGELRERRGSWTRAVGDYHSTTPSLSGRYRLKVFQTLFAERRRAKQASRAAR